ncbi:MAG: PQQ-dependent sugar dehydrogenase [Williamsia sp.]|nr:PQQ-dependent sugar dehydrogenase [Williamsia sp.]
MLSRCLPLKNRLSYLVIVALCMFSCTSLSPQTPQLSFNPVVTTGLSSPVDIVNASDGSNRLFVVEKGGTIKIFSGGVLSGTNFLDISAVVNSATTERGLLSLAFHPAYSTNGYFFVYYTALNGDVTIARYHVSSDPNLADASSGQVLLSVPHREFPNHNGGKLNFGADGNLYFALGDGGSGGDPHFNAQNGNSFLGKMLRINVDNFTTAPYYTVPADNPYVADPAVADEIWALGLRNPFRWSFDRLTHDMWIADVGQDAWEEVDFRPANSTGGINYGWRCYEGTHSYNDSGCAPVGTYVSPIFEYGHNSSGGYSITGGIVYRGTAYPDLYGWYICADYISGNTWLIKPNGSGGWTVQSYPGLQTNIAGFGETESAELYAVGLNGRIYRVQTSVTLPVKLQAFRAAVKNGQHQLSWTVDATQPVSRFDVQYSSNGSSFQTIGSVPAVTSSTSSNYQYLARIPAGENAFYRLKILEKTGAEEYSAVVKLELSNDNAVQIRPTLVQNERLTIQLEKAFSSLHVMDVNGHVVRKKALDGSTGTVYADLSGLAKGIYIIKLIGSGRDVVRKIVVQ